PGGRGRRDFLPSEAVAIGMAIEEVEAERARERQALAGPAAGKGKKTALGKFPEAVTGRAADKAAESAGVDRRTYEKARAVVEAATREPARYPNAAFGRGRRDFLPSEAVAIGMAIEEVEAERARERQALAGPAAGKGKKSGSGKLPEAVKGDARDKAAAASGVSGRTYEKARAVVEAATREPARYPNAAFGRGHVRARQPEANRGSGAPGRFQVPTYGAGSYERAQTVSRAARVRRGLRRQPQAGRTRRRARWT
ncbi:MAG: hypothetical protein HY719_14955, partial [Planctomycetes bacterium]|nr:hypothetical protein [Planctomycetota bacterium]